MKSTKYTSLEIDRELNPFLEQEEEGTFVQSNPDLRHTAPSSSTKNDQPVYGDRWSVLAMGVIVGLTVLNIATLFSNNSTSSSDLTDSGANTEVGFTAQSISFGSCSSYDLRQMNIWTDAVIPSMPDAWIWTGDMVYLDDNEINCAIFESSMEWQQSCNCSQSWLLNPPYTCHAGDVEYANQRWVTALNNEPYNKFLDYMCPKSRSLGIFPPRGSDPSVCDKPIYGTYDDHDFGGNNGNRREPDKREFKSMYLDALGEPADSPRRGANRGAWHKETIKIAGSTSNQEVDIFLLDERYEREPLPCEARRDYCRDVVMPDTTGEYSHEKGFCKDFLLGGPTGQGTCCTKDGQIFNGWCLRPDSATHPFYRYACDVTFDDFGMKSLYINGEGDLVEPDGSEPMDLYQDSSICEVLGKQQRKWLRREVAESTAAVKLFVSGSVLLYNPLPYMCGSFLNATSGVQQEVQCRCGGDNLDCYSAAQREILHLIQSTRGCPVVLTGDYHFSDIKSLQPGPGLPYSGPSVYDSGSNLQAVPQVMASGMSESTAKQVSCEGYRLDPLGLRTHAECDFVRGPNFGRMLLELSNTTKELETIRLQVLSGVVADSVLLEHVVRTSSCRPLS